MDKYYRRNQILALVSRDRITTQAELRRKLAQRGIRVTQATVSRDLENLGLAKTRTGYALVTAGPAPEAQPEASLVLKEFLREVKLAANLVVIKTHPGNAHTVAVALERQDWPEVVGAVAGDDTVLIATQKATDAARTRRKIMQMLAR